MKENNLKSQEDFSIKDQFQQYLRYWPWFILSLIFFITFAWLHLRYSSYNYVSEATILIKDDKNSSLSEIAIFEDLGLTGGALNKSQFENEIEILKSKKLLKKVTEKLKLNISYYKEGNIKTSELYEDRPFTLKVLDDEKTTRFRKFYIKIKSSTEFEIKLSEDGEIQVQKFGEKFQVNEVNYTLVPLPQKINDSSGIDENFHIVSISSIDNAIIKLRIALKVDQVSKNSSILKLSLVSAQQNKAEAILNELIREYNDDAIYDRNLVSKNTAEFIDNRLAIITKELDSVETDKVSFKEDNRVTDIKAEGQLFLESVSKLNQQQVVISTQIELANSMIDYINATDNNDLLPSNLGIQNTGIENSIRDFNELVLSRKQLLESSTEQNPVVVEITNQIENLRLNTRESLNRLKQSLSIENKDLIRQQNKVGGKISSIPSIAKSARDIERQQTIKESLYLYLLQKREETAISLAVTTPKAKIVDSAYTSNFPISPKPDVIYLAAFILGLSLPFGIVFVKKIFDTKIHNRVDLEREVPGLPILGEIPVIDTKESEVIKDNDRSVLAESFRILRTNLGYFLKNKDGGKVIFVTSTIKGEGKTFVAYNLAQTLISTGKSVLLIGGDIRNPQIHRYIDKKELTIGLSEYLYDHSVEIKTIKNTIKEGNREFDVVLSGSIPPNPAELLMNDRFEKLIEEVKNSYDYIVVDTAPTLLVTDTLLISQLADITVYVCRAEYTDKKLLQYPKELYEEGKIKNLAFAINGIKITNFGYGSKYGYGYGYGQEKPTVYARLKRVMGLTKS